MKTQDFLLSLLAQPSNKAAHENLLKKSWDKEAVGFKDLLDSSLNKVKADEASAKTKSTKKANLKNSEHESLGKNVEKPEQQTKGNSDVGKINRKGEPLKGTQNKVEKSKEEENLQDSCSKEDILMETLAEAIGIAPSELLEVFKALDIKTPNLLSQSGLEKVIERLATFLQLDIDQINSLKAVMKEVTDQLEVLLKHDSSGQESKLKGDDWVQVKNAIVKIVDKHFDTMTRVNTNHIKQTLQKETENSSDQASAEVTVSESLDTAKGEKAAVKRSNLSAVAGNKTGDENSLDKSVINNQTDSKLKVNQDGEKDTEGFSGNPDTSTSNLAEKVKLNGHYQLKETLGEELQFNSVLNNKISGSEEIVESIKLNRQNFIPKQEIINQVIDKAKVVLSGERSEMVINLKPDHLGKLSLKVVTEHGMVAAKIVAENQQVKQILESNMQLLKESLEKQGMTVQGFSVSVRQDSSQSSFSDGRGGKDMGKPGVKTTKEYIGSVSDSTGLSAPLYKDNPYEWSEGSINLTA